MARRTKNKNSKKNRSHSPKGTGPRPHISLDGDQFLSAVKMHQQGKLEEAKQVYESILSEDPNHVEAIHLSGLIQHQQGEHNEAIAKIERALELKPDAILFRKNLASVYRSAGDLEKAKQLCLDVLALEPSEPVVLSLLAKIHEQQGNWPEAIRLLKQAISTESDALDLIDLTISLGDCYSNIGNRDLSMECFQSVLEVEPKHLVATHNFARELHFLDRLEEAERYYLQALEIDPNCASALNNLGVIYQTQAKFEQAKQYAEKAYQLQPSLADVHNNLANIYECLGDGSRCREMFEQAIALRPDYPEAHHSRAQLDLREGNFAIGWDRYQWRHKKKDHDHRYFAHKIWKGEPLEDERLLVYSEQGVGDLIMFATCLPDVFQRVKHVSIEVDDRLVSLFQRSFPDASVIARDPVQTTEPITIDGIDFQTSLADLPRFFRNSEEDFPRQQQILVPDQVARQVWKRRYETLGEGLKVGISWFGGKNLEMQARRSIPLEKWEGILQTPGVHFINLQYGDSTELLKQVKQKFGVTIHDWEESDPLKNLDDFSAQLAELDLVISIDNATVHFAGGVGTPTWCLLNKLPDWRWMLEREQTLWYRSCKLLRQQTQGDWEPVLSKVKTDLQALAEKSSTRCPETAEPVSSDASTKACKVKPRCAIISPIGPGHDVIYQAAANSIRAACEKSAGPFREIIPFRIDDSEGKIGRSRARNAAVQQAAQQGIEWVFFLDADDMLVPDIFINVEPYLDNYDAIWGQIFSFDNGTSQAKYREGQLGTTDRFSDILNNDPYYTLQMGHFVRTEIALANPFNEQMDVGEDFDYYLRIWEKHRCIKLGVPLFANRRGLHSGGPRSATGRDWTTVVNQLLQQYRNRISESSASAQGSPNEIKKQPVPTPHAAVQAGSQSPKHVQRGMKLAIYGMMRSGTTLLCDKLTVPGKGIVLLEPNIHLGGGSEHLRKQLETFGISISQQEWEAGTSGQAFPQFFDTSILPELNRLDYWGVKMVNFTNWREFLQQYPTENLILCVRDIRDVVLSALDLAPKLDHFVDEKWIEKRALETASALVEMSKLPHYLIRYEQMCENPELIDSLAQQIGLSGLGKERMGLESVPHRLYEEKKHQGKVTNVSVNRFEKEPDGPAKQLAEKVWKQAGEYCMQFGYKTATSQPELPKGFSALLKKAAAENPAPKAKSMPAKKTQQKAGKDFTDYWQRDRLANIIPINEQWGEFPEGWDVRPFLWEMLRPHLVRKMVEIGCGYGRLCQAIPTDYYLGVDINPEAVSTARKNHPSYEFREIGFNDAYPKADAILAYTVLLHIDDETIGPMITRMCQASDVILIAEILGKKRWRRDGNPPVFNRDLQDYAELMNQNDFYLAQCEEKPYLHYPDTEITFMKFVRK